MKRLLLIALMPFYVNAVVRIKTFTEHDIQSLDKTINTFLRGINDSNFIDIKFESNRIKTYLSDITEYTAFVIYKSRK